MTQNKRVFITKYQLSTFIPASANSNSQMYLFISSLKSLAIITVDKNIHEYYEGLIGSHYLSAHLYPETKTSQL